jgi:hypothetical protein
MAFLKRHLNTCSFGLIKIRHFYLISIPLSFQVRCLIKCKRPPEPRIDGVK